jgi:hypothetical protein
VVTVEADAGSVERRLAAGDLLCPGCGFRLSPWGWARQRVLRGPAEVTVRLRPRRAYCRRCATTHVLLPVVVLARRADLVEVIGAALVARATGAGSREIAALVGRPVDTVRGWLRRFAARAGPLREAFTALLCAVDTDPRPPGPAGSLVADAVAAIAAAAAAVRRRWGVAVFAVSAWQVAAAVTSGRLLAPMSTVELTNTSRLW